MKNTLQKLIDVNLLTPNGLFHLLCSFYSDRITLLALLRFASRLYPEMVAIADDNEQITYRQLYRQSQQLGSTLRERHNLGTGDNVAILCRNHISLIQSIFAVSATGADMYLLNIEMSAKQITSFLTRFDFKLIIHDPEVIVPGQRTLLSYHATLPSVQSLSKRATKVTFPRASGKIVALTGGTSGHVKTTERKPNAGSLLHPFFALLKSLDIRPCSPVFIATPVYHGFGLASLLLSIISGARIYVHSKFDACKIAQTIVQNEVETITLVPLMLQRLLSLESASYPALKTIISGGAALHPKWVSLVQNTTAFRLYNLYGTSEAGFSIMATPEDLQKSPTTLGRKIKGVQLKILDAKNNQVRTGGVGRICIKSAWASRHTKNGWNETGDLGYVNSEGLYFLSGRNDDMIVSGGQNVYPMDLENLIGDFPGIREAAVVGVPDDEFGQRLVAFAEPEPGADPEKAEIMSWLAVRAARFQMPRSIEWVDSMPHTPLGKPDKKALLGKLRAPEN